MTLANVVMTGATRGIGFAVAQHLLAQDQHLVILARNPEQFMDQISPVDQDKVVGLQVDLESTASVADACTYLQGIEASALVNNAGISTLGAAEDQHLDEYLRVMQVNFFSALHLSRAVLPGMRQQRRGRIVMVSSLSGLFGLPGEAAYCSSKFAMEGLAESLRYEVTPFGISVSVVNPGYTRTELAANTQFSQSVPDASPYHAYLKKLLVIQQKSEREGEPVSVVADAVADAVLSDTPAFRYLPGSAAQTYDLWKAESDTNFAAVVKETLGLAEIETMLG